MHLRTLRGAATMVITMMLMVAATLVVMFGASYSILQQRTTANQFYSSQSFEAASAGLEYGIVYLLRNYATIIASPSGGYINYTTGAITNVALSNGSTFSITFTNPTQNDYTLIKVTATGVSSDGSSTKVITQEVQRGSILYSPGNTPLVAKGSFNISGNSVITNTQNNSTIVSGGAVSMSGSSKTILSSGTSSTPGNIKSDITQNNSTISGQSASDFFSSYFGAPASIVQGSFSNVYTNSSTTNYSSTLNGKTGTTIWINQTSGTATINGNTTIGSAANPVILVINGQASFSGNLTIYGFVFIVGATSATTDFTGNINITGGMVVGDAMTMSGNANINFSSSVNSTLQNSSTTTYNARIPGSWADF